jgi:CheY-like chemotaxis protein
MRILLVEDNTMNSTFVIAVLEPEGHDVTLVKTGPAGYAAALQSTFGLIILDIALPGLRGDVICVRLRASGMRTPIVALTASAMPDQLAIVTAAGFDEVLTKPIEPKALRAMVSRYEPLADMAEPDPVS